MEAAARIAPDLPLFAGGRDALADLNVLGPLADSSGEQATLLVVAHADLTLKVSRPARAHQSGDGANKAALLERTLFLFPRQHGAARHITHEAN